MPYYEYRCVANGRTVEVRHGMSEQLETWGEVAGRAGVALGATPADAPVERLLSAPVPMTGGTSSDGADFQGCGTGCACARNA
jgi:predicted nucleic acid-binding Zn ribbon protein